jgi:hypothetical protein
MGEKNLLLLLLKTGMEESWNPLARMATRARRIMSLIAADVNRSRSQKARPVKTCALWEVRKGRVNTSSCKRASQNPYALVGASAAATTKKVN